MKKILITGATGFIGKNFLKLKNLQKNKLYCLVRKKIKSKKKITWYETAIEDSRNLKKIKKKITEIDTLYHFAWGNLPNYQSKIHTTEELKKQKFFLKNMIDFGVKKIVVTGTCYEYGLKEGLIYNTYKTNPVVEYAKAKVKLYRWLKNYQKKKFYNLIWLRLFFVYGNGQSKKSLLQKIVECERKGKKYFHLSKGDQIRDYINVKSAVKQIYDYSKKFENGVFNISSGKPVTLKNHILRITKKNKLKIKLKFGKVPYLKYEPKIFWGLNKY